METYRMQEQEMPYRDEGSQANERIYNSTHMSMPAQTQKRKLTASALLYLFLSFPLGLIYFILVIVLFSVGFGTIIVWVGLPLLLLLLLMLRGIATLERDMAAGMLDIAMPHVAPKQPVERQGSLLRWIRAGVRDSVTWRTLLYVLFIKFPLGIVSFTVVVTLPLLALGLTFEPLVYMLNVFIQHLVWINTGQPSADYMPFIAIINGQFDPLMFLRSFLGIPCGILAWIGTRYILSGLAQASGILVRSLLCNQQPILSQPKQEELYPRL
ncbi:sensor domain-containing protein [Ktedonobacteria bacterium brp13]|nr:sensor domain-containing protein [Ktedonobacteria bacterium brp13]